MYHASRVPRLPDLGDCIEGVAARAWFCHILHAMRPTLNTCGWVSPIKYPNKKYNPLGIIISGLSAKPFSQQRDALVDKTAPLRKSDH